MAVLIVAGLVAGCSAVPAAPSPAYTPRSVTLAPASPTAAPSTSAPTPAPTTAGPAPTSRPTATRAASPLKGRTIVVDPGHNGVWTRALLRKVPAGNGRTKACNSSGTASNTGYAEHAFTWDVGTRLATALRRLGATVVLTRPNDRGSGPCVNERAAITNRAHADLLISIHADGSFGRGDRGFHVIVSTTMAGGPAVEADSLRFAKTVRNLLETRTSMPRSTYIGRGTALSPRTDIAGLNLSRRVGVMVEMGNMRNATDLALLTSPVFRQRAAEALAAAAVATVGR